MLFKGIYLISKYIGRFAPKNPQKYRGDPSNIIFRSLIEYRYMKYFDENSSFLEWSSEELFVYYRFPIPEKDKKHKIKRYFPDFIVKIRKKDGSEKYIMIEVKCDKESREPAPIEFGSIQNQKKKRRLIKERVVYEINRAKWEAARKFCEEKNWDFQVLTDKNLPKIG